MARYNTKWVVGDVVNGTRLTALRADTLHTSQLFDGVCSACGRRVLICPSRIKRMPGCREHFGPRAKANARRSAMVAKYVGGMTLQRIAEEYQVTRERVRQIVSRGFSAAELGELLESADADRLRQIVAAIPTATLRRAWLACTLAGETTPPPEG